MPYCPKCKSEYQEGFKTCAECAVPLVAALEEKTEPQVTEAVEVFVCSDPTTAQKICDVILHEFPTVIRRRSQAAFPVPAVSMGSEIIAVDQSMVEKALQVLREAIEDGAITEADGGILDGEGSDEEEEEAGQDPA